MGKKKSRQPAPRTALSAAADILQAAPAAATPGDKTALGQAHGALEAVLALLSGPDDRLAANVARLSELAEKLILDEVEKPQAAEAFLFAALADLALVLARADAEAILQAMESFREPLECFLPSPDRQPDAADVDGAETGAAAGVMEKINLSSQEDIIIYTEFIAESTEHLERIEAGTLELETAGINMDLVNDMFRCFHSMKGAAGFLGLTTMNNLCHEIETLLDRARKMTLVLDRPVIDVLLAAIDIAKQLLRVVEIRLAQAQGIAAKDQELPVIDIRPVLAAVKQLLARKPVAATTVEEDAGPHPDKMGGILVGGGMVTQDQLTQALEQQRRPLGQVLVEMGAAEPEHVQEALVRQAATGKPAVTSVKVDTSRLDLLLEMVGELVIAETQVAQDKALLDEANSELMRNVANLSKTTQNLQELVMAIRMMPVKQTFRKMYRLVRDTARKTGKEVQLLLSGEDTEIDKTVIEKIADPLVHTLRNAVDHGIEKPEVREAAGKPRQGTIMLSACQQGGNIVIEITDDGAGIDRKRILAKAIEKGFASEHSTYTDTEIYNFMMLPGFSTHAAASDISGRGVGLDVVRRNIEGLGGRVDISSTPGKGAVFTIRLPLTMAIVDGMIVRVGEERFVIPTLSIKESIRPRRQDISTVAQRGEIMMMRGELVPLIRMHRLFQIEKVEYTDPWKALIIVIAVDGKRCGLMVDHLLGQQQVVIKNLGPRLQGLQGISGGCILGDGRVGLILDAGELIELAESNTVEAAAGKAPELQETGKGQ